MNKLILSIFLMVLSTGVVFLGVLFYGKSEGSKSISMSSYGNLSQIHSGYVGGIGAWRKYFECIAQKPDFTNFSKSALKMSGKIYDTHEYDEKILTAETKLNIKLPKSYVDFVKAGGIEFFNGLTSSVWGNASDPSVERIISPSQIGLLKVSMPSEYDAWRVTLNGISIPDQKYYAYHDYKDSHKTTWADSIYIDQPRIDNFLLVAVYDDIQRIGLIKNEVTKDGEFEAWSLSSHIPGAMRYRSFAELLINEYVLRLRGYLSKDEGGHYYTADDLNDGCTPLILDVEILQRETSPAALIISK